MIANPNDHPPGTRLLWDPPGIEGVRGMTIIEWSPSGKYMKWRGDNGQETWTEKPPEILELLPTVPPLPPRANQIVELIAMPPEPEKEG